MTETLTLEELERYEQACRDEEYPIPHLVVFGSHAIEFLSIARAHIEAKDGGVVEWDKPLSSDELDSLAFWLMASGAHGQTTANNLCTRALARAGNALTTQQSELAAKEAEIVRLRGLLSYAAHMARHIAQLREDNGTPYPSYLSPAAYTELAGDLGNGLAATLKDDLLPDHALKTAGEEFRAATGKGEAK